MRVLLASDPKVIRMADFLAVRSDFARWLLARTPSPFPSNAHDHVTPFVTRSVTVTGLLAVWGVTSDRGERDKACDLRVTHCSLRTLDGISGVPGFGLAMSEVGWAREDGADLVLPSFLRENACAEDRSMSPAAIRKRRQREREREAESATSEPVTTSVTSDRDKSDLSRVTPSNLISSSLSPDSGDSLRGSQTDAVAALIPIDKPGYAEATEALSRWKYQNGGVSLDPIRAEPQTAWRAFDGWADSPPIVRHGEPVRPIVLVPLAVEALMADRVKFKSVKYALGCVQGKLDEWRLVGFGAAAAPKPKSKVGAWSQP